MRNSVIRLDQLSERGQVPQLVVEVCNRHKCWLVKGLGSCVLTDLMVLIIDTEIGTSLDLFVPQNVSVLTN